MNTLTDEEFAEQYKVSTPGELADKLGTSYMKVTAKASYLRRKGYDIPLKRPSAEFLAEIGRRGGLVRGVAKGFAAGEAGRDRARHYGKVGGRTRARVPKGFAANLALASEAGKLGGRTSKRKKQNA